MCSDGCNNTLGSFHCYCDIEGYMIDSDDRTCVGKYYNKMMFFNVFVIDKTRMLLFFVKLNDNIVLSSPLLITLIISQYSFNSFY